MKVVVIGAGLMGSQIAADFLLAGSEVIVVARQAEAAATRVRAALDLARDLELASPEALARAESGVAVVMNVEEADHSADLVVESIVEEFDAKALVLHRAARALPEAVLATNTSSLSITALGRANGARDRTLGMHFLNPPLLLRPVEVVCGAETARETVDRACEALRGVGKLPVVIEREVPGFVWNRLQFALLREALWLAEQGVATAEQVDVIVKEGLARRWRYTGPFETVGLGGPTTFATVAANLFPELSAASAVDDLAWQVSLTEARLRDLRQARDRGLARELRSERDVREDS